MAQRGALSAGARIVRSRPAWIARLAARLLRPELWRPGGQREGPPAASGAGRGRTGLAGSCAAPAANSGAGAMVSAETPAQTPCGELGSGSGGSRATWGPSGTEQGRTPPLPGKAVWGQAPEAHSAQRGPVRGQQQACQGLGRALAAATRERGLACVCGPGVRPPRRGAGRLQALAPRATRADTPSAVILSPFAHVARSALRVFSGETVIIPTLGAETAATEARDKPTVTAVAARRAHTQDREQACPQTPWTP